jgi:hypothetical protein
MITLAGIIQSFGPNDKVINFSTKTRERIGPQGAKEIF